NDRRTLSPAVVVEVHDPPVGIRQRKIRKSLAHRRPCRVVAGHTRTGRVAQRGRGIKSVLVTLYGH
ncbi:MAG: hypothetical protein NZ990_05485, partial [Myxococcota bacterium]|nr:hypothetical protein [Myxococcota bacterium]